MEKRYALRLILCLAAVFLLFAGFAFAANSTALAIDYRLAGEEIIGEGTTLRYYDLYTKAGTMPARVISVDLNNPHVEIQAMHPKEGFNNRQTVKQMTAEQNAVAAVNADFFHLTIPAAPFGLHMEKGEILSSPTYNSSWLGFGIDQNKRAHILNWWFRGKVICNGEEYELYGYNQNYRNNNSIFLFDRHWGREISSTFFDKPALKVTVRDGRVFSIEENTRSTPIPHDGFVLVAEGNGARFLEKNARVGSKIEYSLGVEPDINLDTSVGGHVVLVDNGLPVDPARLPSPGSDRASRTAVGHDSAGKKVYFVTIDGTSAVAGATMEELSIFMSHVGAHRALNLDGGGSATMTARKLGEFDPILVSRPRLSSERAVPNAIGIFNRAPKTTAAGLFLRGDEGLLVGTETTYRVSGYDRHYHPLEIASQELDWEVSDPERAQVINGTLRAKQQGQITLRVSFQGVTQEKDVYIYGGKDITSLQIEPEEIRLLPGQSIPLSTTVKTFDGLTLEAGPETVSWQTDIGRVENNTFFAGPEEGFGTLTAEIEEFKMEIPVRIGGKREEFFAFLESQTVSFRAHPENLPGSFEIQKNPQFVYTGERSGRLKYDFTRETDSVMIAYGQLGSGKISMGTNNLGVSAWIYGDGSGYWLRAEIIDAHGKKQYLDLARSVDWKGWRRVQGAIDPTWPQPLILSSIYLVQEPEKRASGHPKTGTIYIDNVEAIKGLGPDDEKDQEKETRPPPTVPHDVEMRINATEYWVGGKQAVMDAAPFIENGRTFVPVRYLGEAFQAEASWTQNPDTGQTEEVILENEETKITMVVGSYDMTVQDKAAETVQEFAMDVAPQIKEGRTYLPFRAIGEYGLGAEVGYSTDPGTRRVDRVWFNIK